MVDPDSRSSQNDAGSSHEIESTPAGIPQRRQSTSCQSEAAPKPDTQQRPANNVAGSNASRTFTASMTPSTSNTYTSYASFPSQYSTRAPSTAASQPSVQSQMQPRVALPPANIAPQGVREYQNVTSVEPAPKRPLWSLGSTLPRVRRLPAKPTKTAYPTPGSRSNIVQQPPVMVPMQSIGTRARNYTEARCSASNQCPSDPPGGPEELVRGNDFADTTGNENYTATGVVDEGRESEELRASSEASDPTSAATGDLPPIVEGEPLPTNEPSLPAREPSQPIARPRLDYSFSSPTVGDTAAIRVIGDDKLGLSHTTKQGQNAFGDVEAQNGQKKKNSSDLQNFHSSDPQQKLSAARKQLVQEAQHGDGLLATQGSAVDANDYDYEDEEPAGRKPTSSLGGVRSHPVHKHIKTSSMPFLPSQGFDVMVAAPSHKGADQPHTESQDRKKAKKDLQNRSALEQTRHPGLSGARPTPRGRAAGGPAAGVGIRKPSTQSNRRGSNATKEDRSAVGYFDEDVPSHELTHLDRQGSSRHRRMSQPSHQADDHHVEARTARERTSSHQSSNGRDTRSAWLSRSMPSHASRQNAGGERSSGEENEKKASSQQGRDDIDPKGIGGRTTQERHSEETAYSSFAHQAGDTSQEPDLADEGAHEDLEWEAEQKGYVEDDDEMWLGGQGTYEDGSIAFPTLWSRWRYHSREFLAELLATMLLITVGTAVDCQVTLSQSTGQSAGSYLNQNWAWGIAVASTIYLSGGRSGAHYNPAITLALAVFRGFPWIQVPIYWSAQLLGSILGAAITYGIYLPAIDQFEGGAGIRTLTGDTGTGRLFVTVPQLVFTPGSGFGTEVVATSILMAMVLAVGDETNAPPSDGLSALVLGFVVVMIGMSFGWPTSYAISPSRDLGPRLFLYMVGYGKELWTHNSYWWIYGPQVGCFTGGLIGALLYDLAIFTGEESPINYTWQGWKQSTPARVGSRLLNSAERLEFWTSPLRRVRHGQTADGDAGKEGNDFNWTETRGGPIAHLRSDNAAVDTKKGYDGAMSDIGPLEDTSLPRLSGADDGQRRHQSHISQQLDAQEQGRSLSTLG